MALLPFVVPLLALLATTEAATAEFAVAETAIEEAAIVEAEFETLDIGFTCERPGYNFYPLHGSHGNDIRKSSKRGDALLSECSHDSKCKGFVTSGWLKKYIRDEKDFNTPFKATPGVCLGLYVKCGGSDKRWACTGAGCKRSGYNFYPLSASPGNDIRHSSSVGGDLITECTRNPECKGFTTSGWLKEHIMDEHKFTHPFKAVPGECLGLYVKCGGSDKRWECQDHTCKKSGYNFYPLRDSDGRDIRQSSSLGIDLTFECTRNPGCKGFNTNGWQKYHIINQNQFSTPFKAQHDKCLGLYVKCGGWDRRWMCQDTSCARADYNFYPLKDSPGNDLRRSYNKAVDLLNDCSQNPSCKGYNTNGWVKYSIRDANNFNTAFRPVRGACRGLYVKCGGQDKRWKCGRVLTEESPLMLEEPQFEEMSEDVDDMME